MDDSNHEPMGRVNRFTSWTNTDADGQVWHNNLDVGSGVASRQVKPVDKAGEYRCPFTGIEVVVFDIPTGNNPSFLARSPALDVFSWGGRSKAGSGSLEQVVSCA